MNEDYLPPRDPELFSNRVFGQELSQKLNPCFAEILQSTRDCVKVLDMDGRLLSINAEGQECLGISNFEAFRGMFWPDLWSGSGQLAAAQAVAQAKAGERGRYQAECRTLSGQSTWWDVSIMQLHPVKGEAGKLLVISLDITEQKSAGARLERHKAQLQLVVDNVPAIMAYVDEQGICRWVNRGYQDWYGVKLADVVGRNSIEWMAANVGRDYAEQLRPKLQQALAGQHLSFEADQFFKGRKRKLSLCYTPDLDESGRVQGAVILVIDVTRQHETAEALKASSQRFRTLTESVPSIVWCTGEDGQLDYLSDRFRVLTGCEPTTGPGAAWDKVVHPDDRSAVSHAWQTAAQTGALFYTRCRLIQQDGSYRWFLTQALPERNESEEILRWVGISTDIHDQVESEAALRESNRSYRLLFHDNPQAMWTYDPSTLQFTSVNRAATAMYGYTEEEFLGMKLTDIRPAGDAPGLLSRVAAGADRIRRTVPHIRKDGTPIFVDIISHDLQTDGPGRTRLVVATDVTERVRLNQELIHLAEHDQLTGLPNRVLLSRGLEQAITRAKAEGSRFAFLAIDFDRFKEVNDTFGHRKGDTFLAAAAGRLRSSLEAADILARVGGDEFVAIIEGFSSVDDGSAAADLLVRAFGSTISVLGLEIQSSISLGLALFPDDANEPEDLQRCADQALYAAKKSGGNCCRRFSDTHSTGIREVLEIQQGLRSGISDGRLQVLYQPIVSSDGQIQRLEALLRFEHRTLGEVAPDRFIPIAEQSGLILPIGEWVLQQTCRQISRWAEEGKIIAPVSVNVSALQLSRSDFAEKVKLLLSDTGIPPDMLQIELTESLLMANPSDSLLVLRQLKAAGIRIAIDDFGTGYSSLSYLHDFPLDVLKIDRSFVQRVTTTGEGQTIIHAIVQLARSLRLQVVAEGVETAEQRDELIRLGCDLLQGYLFARPMDASAAGDLLPIKLAPCTFDNENVYPELTALSAHSASQIELSGQGPGCRLSSQVAYF